MDKPSVLLINGSPHKKGCTNRALEEVACTLETEGVAARIFWIGAKPLSGCSACKKCAGIGRCAFHDKVNDFLDMAADFDGYVFGTPVHWGSATGAVTSFMDRVFYAALLGGASPFRLKPAASVASARRAGTTATYDQVNKYFGLMQMPIATSQYWNMVHGASPEDVEQDIEGLQTMRTLARNMAYLIACRKAADAAGVAQPEQEPSVFTNFIR